MTEECASPRWAWPITLDSYDRNPELRAEETEKLRANAPSLADGVAPSIVIEKCGFPRLMKPLEDVSTHIELHRKYWPNLKALMVRDMAARGKSFWSWRIGSRASRRVGMKNPRSPLSLMSFAGSTHCTNWGATTFCSMGWRSVSSAVRASGCCSVNSRKCLRSGAIATERRKSIFPVRCAKC